MTRRDFITLLGGAAAVWPLAGHPQQPAMPVIGFLGSESPDRFEGRVRAFLQGLADMGYVEGRNFAIEYRWAEGKNDRLPQLAAELVDRRVAVIAAIGGTPAALAAKAATSTIPIIFNTGGDPVKLGLVKSLNHPSGNLTGVTPLGVEVGPKRLELVHELVPDANVVALLVNPSNPTLAETVSRETLIAAKTLGLQLHVLRAATESDFDAVFESLKEKRAGALVIGTDIFFSARSEKLAMLTVRHAVPAIYQYHEFAAAGGLMSYGGSLSGAYRQVGVYTGRVLKGESPADLPVQQATKVELIINMKTAKTLGITVPLSLLGRADEVIE